MPVAPPTAATSLGSLHGAWRDGIACFRGVPYAAQPVGERRFAPAAPPSAWTGPRDATRHGPIAPQLPSRLRVAMGDFDRPQAEACLTLTIATPSPDAAARPVLVWLHGGAWISGAGSLDWYDGTRLARDGDLVFVGVNYRLGALGWLHKPGLVDQDGGTSDMIAALRWVRAHIAAFGGDPGNVTLMGQSAGATSIGRLLMLPEARPLFHRAIIQSGGFGRGAYSSAMAAERADQFLRLLGIGPDAGDALDRLRTVEVPRLLAAQAELARANARFAQTMPMFMPVLPSPLTQAEWLEAIAAGAAGKPILVGATADEVHAFYAADPAMAEPPRAAVLARFGGDASPARYRARRPDGSPMDLLADLGTEETFLRPAFRLAEAVARRGGDAHAYLFDWAPPGSPFRACHCIELPFVFGDFAAWPDATMLHGGDPARMAALSDAMRQAWISFVRTGVTDCDAVPEWPRYQTTAPRIVRFGDPVRVADVPTPP